MEAAVSDNRATRAHIAASRGYRHDHLSTDELLADETADALMRDVNGQPAEYSGPRAHRPVTRERAAHCAQLLRRLEERPDPWGNDPDRTTRHWRPGSAR
jgi:hypothetical protein